MAADQTPTDSARRCTAGRFDAFDEASEAIRRWGLDFRQLDSGPSPASLFQISTPEAHLLRLNLSRSYDQRGEAPPNMHTIGLVFQGSDGVLFQGRPLSGSEICSFGASHEWSSISRPGFGCWTVSFSEEHLAAMADVVGRDDPLTRNDESRARRAEPSFMQALLHRLEQLTAELGARPAALQSDALTEELSFDLPALLIATLTSTRDSSPVPPSRARDRAVQHAREFIEDRREEPLTIRELCDATGVSWRTLDYAFVERFGVTPKAYLTAIRLHRVRKALREAEAEMLIADLANRSGFWHMGQFAADYRRHFGELPSQTKRRSLACRGLPS